MKKNRAAFLMSAAILLAAAAISLFFLFGPPGVAAVRPVRGLAVQAVYATGTVEASVMLPLAPRQTARLVELFADEGQRTEKGQLLAQFEDEDARNLLAEMKAAAELARKEYERRATLAERGTGTREAADQAKATLETAIARVEQAEASLGYLRLYAPEDSIVIRRDGERGELIPANQPVFWLSRRNGLRVTAEVDEEDIALVEPGQEAVIRADAFPGETFAGRVQSITPMGDPVARSYRVRISLPKETKLMIGMTAEANIVIREVPDALLVPAGAVSDNNVWIIHNGKLIRRTVETGVRTPQAVEIRAGLEENSLVVQDASQDFGEGQSARAEIEDWSAP